MRETFDLNKTEQPKQVIEQAEEESASSVKIMIPYFDVLLEKFQQGETAAKEAFGSNVHVGYWEKPTAQAITPTEFGEASRRMLEEILDQAQIVDRQRVLDVGCGFGGTIEEINSTYRDCELTGVNIDDRQIAIGRKNVQPKNGNEVSFVQADAGHLPFENAAYDRMLCVEAIFHFPSREEFFKEAARVLKPGGRLVITDFVPLRFLGPLAQAFERATGLVGKAYGPLELNISSSGYKRMADQSGLRVDAVRDVTRNTLQTYQFFRQHFHLIKEEKAFRKATSLIEHASRTGAVRYLILSFVKK